MIRARYGRSAVVLLGVLGVAVLWNAARYPLGLGYDARNHVDYLVGLIEHGALPDGTGEYYTPPLFYALAGVVWKVGGFVGLSEPLRLVQLFDGGLAIGAAVLLLELARTVFPGRRRLHVLALVFFIASAIVLKTAAMVHPETLSMVLALAALVVAARMLTSSSFGIRPAVVLGVLLGAGQLVRAFSLWTFAVVVLTFTAAAVAKTGMRRPILRALAIAVVGAAVVAAPWYAYQATRYTNPIFDRPQVATPLWERRPASFYLDSGFPDVIARPYRDNFLNRFWPTVYAEWWGDYFGHFAWNASDSDTPPRSEARDLVLQSVTGLLPTALMIGGWLGLFAATLRRRVLVEAPERLLVCLLPLAGLAGLLYFCVSYPTADGDVIKATYMLTTVPCWALCFGLAAERIAGWLPRTLRPAAMALAVAFVVVGVRYGLYGRALGGLL